MKQSALNEILLAHAKNGDKKDILFIIKLGADVNTRAIAGQDFPPALVIAALNSNIDAVEALIENGADVNAQTKRGDTALLVAVQHNNLDMMNLLLSAGADFTIEDKNRQTAYSFAQACGMVDFCERCDNFSSEKNVDEVVFESMLERRKLKEIFNFASGERVTLLLKNNGDVISMMRESFSVIDDKKTLRCAFDMHRAQGGKADESIIYGSQDTQVTVNKAGFNRMPS